MADWLLPAIISTLAATLILAGAFFQLWRTERDHFLGMWAASWFVYSARFVFELLDLTLEGGDVFFVASQAAVIVSGVLLLMGTVEFLDRRLSSLWWVAAALLSAWTAVAVLFDVAAALDLDGTWAFALTTGPNFIFVAAVFGLTGVAWLTADRPTSATKATGVLFVVWAIHKLDFPLLRPIEELAPWGYLLSSMIAVSIAVALVFVYFRRAVADLDRSGERYRSLFEGGHTPILVVDAQRARLIEANPAAAEFYGYPLEELVGMELSVLEVMDEDEIADDLDAAIQRGTVGSFRHRHRAADGSIRTVDVQSGKQIVGGREVIVGMVFDVTAEVEAKAALQESEDRYAALFESNQLFVLILEPESLQIMQANPAAGLFYGFDLDEVVGRRLPDVVGAEGTDFVDQLEEALVDGVPYIETRHRRVDGAMRDVEVQVGPMTSGGRTLLSLLISDVTERNQAYIDLRLYRDNLEKIVEARTVELETTNRELEEASRAKSQFLANMSHELRTPLNSIIGFTGILLQGLTGELNDEQERQLDMVNRSGKHLLELINAVLDLSKIEAGRVSLEIAEVDVCDLIDTVIETLAPQAREQGLELFQDDSDRPCIAWTDETRLRQILINLVGNAVKFTEEGSVTVRAVVAEENVIVTVKDTGPGIAPKDLPHVFEEFRQLAPTRGQAKSTGTGLGLPVSLRLAQLLGGDIQAQSTFGDGSTFTVVIPRKLPGAESPPADTADATPRGYDAARVVLLIDDDPSIHDLFRVYLAKEGVRILHAYDLETGMRLLRRQNVSTIILDLEFEDGSGWSLLKHVRADRSLGHINVILCSVRDEREKARRYGASAFLLKPVDKETLTRHVRQALGDE